MIALVSSTIYTPKPTSSTPYRGSISHKQRLDQTIETVQSLLSLNFKDIYILDNSGFNWNKDAETVLKPAIVIKLNSYQFVNKGISEIFALLNGLSVIPDNTPIFKISGRYTCQKSIDANIFNSHDFAGKICHKTHNSSTVGYYVKDKQILEKLLLEALNYIYSYSHKIVGPRSFIQVFENAFFLKANKYNFFDPTISVERGMYMALKNCRVKELDKLFIRGVVAGPYDDSNIFDG